MNFLFFSAQYLPTAGGVERFTAELAHTLVSHGHSATIVTSALPHLPQEETDATGVKIFRLPSHLFMNGRFPVLRPGKISAECRTNLWAQHYDFALINTRFYPLSLWGARQCRRHGVPALVLEHGTKHLSLDSTVLNWLGNAYEHTMMKLVRHYCPVIYGVSLASTQWLEHFHVKAAGVLYNAVDTSAADAAAENPACCFRTRYQLPADAPLITFVGRFIIEKGVRELLSAFTLLRQRLPQAVLIMAGDGPLYQEVLASNQPHVYLTGSISHNETLALMTQSDIFCLPTYSEGFSSTILEAAAAKCCIITTPTGGSPELIQDQKSGILLRDIQPETIAGALYDALTCAGFRTSAGQLVRQRVEERFTWHSTAENLVKIAQDRLAGANSMDDGDNT